MTELILLNYLQYIFIVLKVSSQKIFYTVFICYLFLVNSNKVNSVPLITAILNITSYNSRKLEGFMTIIYFNTNQGNYSYMKLIVFNVKRNKNNFGPTL